jgi:hypothetical protein
MGENSPAIIIRELSRPDFRDWVESRIISRKC